METISHRRIKELIMYQLGNNVELEEQFVVLLPHGSGIDCKWIIDYTKKGVNLQNSYHVMNENGYYTGYIDFTVKLRPYKQQEIALKGPSLGKTQVIGKEGEFNFSISFHGQAVDPDLRDYLEQIIAEYLPNISSIIK